ncbi:helicase-related protein [Mollicutes bacterium LVI A0078]|nr:helicase-related protein [Mollicutes bacterium LVI A0075]WOO91115.1 helicase-related protein [Mollicutes bacterium LVI A0078]
MNNYKLTLLQFAASRFLITNYNNKSSAIIVAVCGAGKTEMCFPLISKQQIEPIAFAIPRIDICNEIYTRLNQEFGQDEVGIHTGKQKVNTDARILVLTTNQLLKYTNHFNLIIIDEVDAFPFDNNPKFYNGVEHSSNNGIFYLTSTPSNRLLQTNLPLFTIYKRWHNKPLPVPKLLYNKNYLKQTLFISLIIRNRKRKLLIFIATISKGKLFSNKLTNKRIDHQFIYSSHPNRNSILDNWKQSTNGILLTTTILERGMTFDDIDVLIIDSDDSFYTKAALVQIAGRARRKKDLQQGQVYFCYSNYTQTIKDSITFINENNSKI